MGVSKLNLPQHHHTPGGSLVLNPNLDKSDKKYLIDRWGHIGLESPRQNHGRFERLGFRLLVLKKIDAGLFPVWYYATLFDNEDVDAELGLRRGVEWARFIAKHRHLRIILEIFYGLCYETVEQWGCPLDYSNAIAVSFIKDR